MNSDEQPQRTTSVLYWGGFIPTGGLVVNGAVGRVDNPFPARYQWAFYVDVELPEPASITLLSCGALMT